MNLYDSLYHNVVEGEVEEEQMKDLVAEYNFRGITVVPVQQQPNGSEYTYFQLYLRHVLFIISLQKQCSLIVINAGIFARMFSTM